MDRPRRRRRSRSHSSFGSTEDEDEDEKTLERSDQRSSTRAGARQISGATPGQDAAECHRSLINGHRPEKRRSPAPREFPPRGGISALTCPCAVGIPTWSSVTGDGGRPAGATYVQRLEILPWGGLWSSGLVLLEVLSWHGVCCLLGEIEKLSVRPCAATRRRFRYGPSIQSAG